MKSVPSVCHDITRSCLLVPVSVFESAVERDYLLNSCLISSNDTSKLCVVRILAGIFIKNDIRCTTVNPCSYHVRTFSTEDALVWNRPQPYVKKWMTRPANWDKPERSPHNSSSSTDKHTGLHNALPALPWPPAEPPLTTSRSSLSASSAKEIMLASRSGPLPVSAISLVCVSDDEEEASSLLSDEEEVDAEARATARAT